MNQSHVDATLQLLRGMQAAQLVATNVEITDSGVKLEGITKWDIIVEHPDLKSPVLDGLGEGPDD